MKIQKPLKFYIDKLENGEKFSLARYGDGELLCMWGKQGKNCDGTRYTPELRQALLDSMKPREGFIHGLQRVLPQDEERITTEYPEIEWYDSEVFTEALAAGELYPLIEQLRKMRVCVIGNKSIKNFAIKELGAIDFREVSKSNAFEDRWDLVLPVSDAEVFLFSCGMAANTFISEFHGRVDGWLIDLGHIWDPFAGKRSRGYLEQLSDEQINKNLHALSR